MIPIMLLELQLLISNLSNRLDVSLNDLSQNYYTNIALKAPLNNPNFTGNVGINYTSPGAKLQVYQSDNTKWAQILSNGNNSFVNILNHSIGLWIRPVDTVSTVI